MVELDPDVISDNKKTPINLTAREVQARAHGF